MSDDTTSPEVTIAPVPLHMVVNGRPVAVHVSPRRSLADFLRDELQLTGTHLGCEHGVCGACTVLLDGTSVRSCLIFAVQCEGRQVTTIEGMHDRRATVDLRETFARHHGLQCGFCTPGMLVAGTELMEETAAQEEPLTDEQVRSALSGNTCRCTGYQGIIDAILDASTKADSPRSTGA